MKPSFPAAEKKWTHPSVKKYFQICYSEKIRASAWPQPAGGAAAAPLLNSPLLPREPLLLDFLSQNVNEMWYLCLLTFIFQCNVCRLANTPVTN